MKKFYSFILMFLLIVPCMFALTACKNGEEPPTNQLSGTDIIFSGAQQKNTEEMGSLLYVTFPNSKLVLSFSDYITIRESSTWSVSLDIYGNIPITSKTVSLEEGDNLYYILVSASNGDSKQYIIMIHRNYLYTVNFETGTDTEIDTIYVEEGKKVQRPVVTLEKVLYDFLGWDWDFTKPVTSNLTITAQWQRQQGSISGNDAKIQLYFRWLSDEVDTIQPDHFQCEVMVEQGTKIGEILALAEIDDFINGTIVYTIEDAEYFIESLYGNEIVATFTTYYMREYPISNHGYVHNPSLEIETNENYEITLEFYEIFITFELNNK